MANVNSARPFQLRFVSVITTWTRVSAAVNVLVLACGLQPCPYVGMIFVDKTQLYSALLYNKIQARVLE